MKQSLTGLGGLSRKLSAILVSVAMLISGVALAADDTIYINQTGNSSTINMTQNGASNAVEGIQGTGTGTNTPAIITGNNNTVNVSQIGSSNTLQLGLQTGTANSGQNTGSGSGNNFTYNVTGNNATAIITVSYTHLTLPTNREV